MSKQRWQSRFILLGAGLAFVAFPLLAQHEVRLRPWIVVTGEGSPQGLEGERMGLCVAAVPAGSPNLPYRAAISRRGRTNFYTLKDSLDTQPSYSIRGENLMLGDLNGDGYIDAVVSNYVAGYGTYDTVIVYWGISEGLDTLHALRIPTAKDDRYLRPGCIGDVNNDGKLDLVLFDSDNPPLGELQIRFGPSISLTTDMILGPDTNTNYRQFGGGGLGVAVADLNGDGWNDLVVRGTFGQRLSDSNWVRVYWGARESLPLDHWTEMHGRSVASFPVACFDANGDGISDLLYPEKDSLAEQWYHINVHLGGADFTARPSFKLANPGSVNNFGDGKGNVIDAGDMNGDGFSDIAIGADEVNYTQGYVFIFGGGPGIDTKYDGGYGTNDAAKFGYSIASLGDVNGDGLSDLLVGAPDWYYLRYQGYWAVLLGSSELKVGVKGTPLVGTHPEGIRLEQNYPNPFNPSTRIKYTVGGTEVERRGVSNVRLVVYDLLGREIKVLLDEQKHPGNYEVAFDASALPSGVYTYRLSVQGTSLARKMLLIR